jgi:PAS domain S-box-containing protein
MAPEAPPHPTSAVVQQLVLSPHDVLAHRAAGVASWIRDLRTNSVAYSPLVGELFGFELTPDFSVQQVVGRIAADDRQAFIDAVMGSMQGRDYRLQVKYTRPDDSLGTVRLTGTCEWIDGAPTRVIGTAVDITEEVNQREHQLLLLTMAAEAGHVATWSYDAIQNRFVSSETHAALYGARSDDDVGTYAALMGFVHPDDRARVQRAVLAEVPGSTRFNLAFRIVRRDGMVRWLESIGTVLRDQTGRLTHILGTTRDVTTEHEATEEREALLVAEREAHEALVEQQRRVSLALRVARIATWTASLRTRVLSVTENTASVFGDQGVAKPTSLDDLLPRIPEPWRSTLLAEVQRLGAHGGTYALEYPVELQDGARRWIAEAAQAMPGLDGRPESVIGVSRDMTDMRVLLDDREAAFDAERRARTEAEAANQAKSDFLARMSHELRTPLNAIIGFADIAARDTTMSARSTAFLHRISANGRQLLEIINDILDVARVEAGRVLLAPEATDVPALVSDVLAGLESLHAGRSLAVTAVAPLGTQALSADPHLLRQILVNLVGNALKFTAQGCVTVHIDADTGGAITAIRVVDTGIGIPAERLASIFDAFEQAEGTTRRRYGGTGLGLTIARNLCALHGWTLTVDSTVGVGSTFRIAIAA